MNKSLNSEPALESMLLPDHLQAYVKKEAFVLDTHAKRWSSGKTTFTQRWVSHFRGIALEITWVEDKIGVVVESAIGILLVAAPNGQPLPQPLPITMQLQCLFTDAEILGKMVESAMIVVDKNMKGGAR